ncbi:Cdc6/Cdc18 family protein [Haloarcula rubripromontorii]|uniref:Cdc6/Cdc18 family protein n=1 Tax=Haloarcula rubripromontorii TaxID=1705562 RepID=UPI00345B9553
MITKPRVFDDDYPATIQHREAELSVLTSAVEPVLEGERGHDVLIHGSKGVGKSALTRHVLEQLNRQQPTPSARVQCLGLSTAGLLRSILQQLPGANPATTTARETLERELEARVTEPTVIVLDEGGDVPDTDALAVLRGIPKLSWIAICHNHNDWLSRADDETRHAVTNWTLGLDKYSTAELTDILQERRRAGLEPNVISDEQLATIADEAAGIARGAIYSLRAAANLAAERSHSTVEDIDVTDAYARATRRMREEALKSLPFHHHVCYEIVRRRDRLSSHDFHKRYDAIENVVYADRDQTPISKRERRTKLTKLVDYDLLGSDGDTLGREYWVQDASISSPLDLTVPVP